MANYSLNASQTEDQPFSPPTESPTVDKKSQKNIVIASTIGNILEFYDFSLFGFLTPLLAPLFFPTSDPFISLILALSTFGMGYLSRPLGSIFFGHIGDRYGRRKALSLSVMLMSIPTVCIAFLPTYNEIGLAAPVLLVLLRLFQGFCTGGECFGSIVYVTENVAEKKSMFFGSVVSSSTAVGSLIGSLTASFVTASFMPSYAWRFAFILGGLIGVIGIYMRRRLPETAFKKTEEKKAPIMQAFLSHPKEMLFVICMISFGSALYSLSFKYISIFLTTYHNWPLSESLFLMSFGGLIFIVTGPIFGYLSDKYGRKVISSQGYIAALFLVCPLFYGMSQAGSFAELLGYQLALGIIVSWSQAAMTAYTACLFPKAVRYSALSFSGSIALAFFGPTLPMISTFLIKWTGDLMMPAYYVTAWAVVGTVCLYFSKERLFAE